MCMTLSRCRRNCGERGKIQVLELDQLDSSADSVSYKLGRFCSVPAF